jgi:hypothetical protein
VVGFTKPECLPHIIGEDEDEDQCDVHKISMYILKDRRKSAFPGIFLFPLTHSTIDRALKKRFVIGSTIIIASNAKQTWRPKDEQCR